MSEFPEPTQQEVTPSAETQEKLRTPSEIISDLLSAHEAVAKGEKSRGFLVSEQLKGAKEMLANGDEEKAFLLMTTAFQSENALMSRKTAEISADVSTKMTTTATRIGETMEKFSGSVRRMGESAQMIDTASRKMGSR